MKVKDVFVQGRRYWVRLHEKGGKEHTIPCHHNLQEFLLDYIEDAGLPTEPNTPLFRTASGRQMDQSAVYYMIARRSRAAGIQTRVCCHTFRATGITAYLKNGGRLEIAQQMANHESSRTTGLYDRRSDDISLDEVERIII
jgi:integrase